MLNTDYSAILSVLQRDGYAVTPQFLPELLITDLREQALTSHQLQLTHKANTGLLSAADLNLRGDYISWLDDATDNSAVQSYLKEMNALQIALNEAFYLSLVSLESHFAIYPMGAGYAKHLDQFHTQKTRKISSILYLNADWQETEGGELRLYLDAHDYGSKYLDILPIGGQLVLFASDQFLHEVLPSKRERVSIAGWFKSRD